VRTWAAIFDWDGVILDSAGQHEQAWEWLVAQNGQALPPDFFLKSYGIKNEKAITELLGWKLEPDQMDRLIAAKEKQCRRLLRENGARSLPGVVALLKRLKARGVPCAIASSTPRLNVDCAMKLLGIRHYFKAIVAGEDVKRGKPDPEVFLLAARRLKVPPERCVVFEDAPVGIDAALAAGMKVVGLATTNPPGSLKRAHRVVRRLNELTALEVAHLACDVRNQKRCKAREP
jgi:beta-phosphoglucomutase family hydrolase